MNRFTKPLTCALAVSIVAMTADLSAEPAQVAELKAAFLGCDRMATHTRLDASTAAACSAVYEQLKARAFEGDWEKLHAWWQGEKQRYAVTRDQGFSQAP